MTSLISSISENYAKINISNTNLIDLDVLIDDVKKLYLELQNKRKSLENNIALLKSNEQKTEQIVEITTEKVAEKEIKEQIPSFLKTQEPINNPKFSDTDQNAYNRASVLFDGYVSENKVTTTERQAIDDIKAVISLNDKFKYLKDLFDNKIEAYNNTIDELNACESSEEAGSLFVEFMTKYNWEYTNPSVLALFELVELRYKK